MGAAAEHRGNALIRRQTDAQGEARRTSEDTARALQIAEDCNEFTRQALAYLAEPRGLRQPTVERAKTRRGWTKRHAALVAAHCAWVDADSRDATAWGCVCVRRAQAAHALLTFALGSWTIPDHIKVPRAAQC
ncbi:hypothetical protein [Azohydromonas aeria]|uniref:hypothetical protein n=1 Tax=Azohydromonas aeria TaxID=2590212 RepID=UPI0012F794F6|nr:hypothetical protein [Azohydromonas aeria]